jgi:hypothetical protein
MSTHDDPELKAALAEVVGDWEPPVEVNRPKLVDESSGSPVEVNRPKLEDESSKLDSRLPLSRINVKDDDVAVRHITVDPEKFNSKYCEFCCIPND